MSLEIREKEKRKERNSKEKTSSSAGKGGKIKKGKKEGAIESSFSYVPGMEKPPSVSSKEWRRIKKDYELLQSEEEAENESEKHEGEIDGEEVEGTKEDKEEEKKEERKEESKEEKESNEEPTEEKESEEGRDEEKKEERKEEIKNEEKEEKESNEKKEERKEEIENEEKEEKESNEEKEEKEKTKNEEKESKEDRDEEEKEEKEETKNEEKESKETKGEKGKEGNKKEEKWETTLLEMNSDGVFDHRPKMEKPVEGSLESSLFQFTSPEMLDEDNKYACSFCSHHNKQRHLTFATKQFLLHTTPRVLTLHLKRFAQTSTGSLKKVSRHISFPLTLDVSPFLAQERHAAYELYGVVCHSGSLSGGHYIAYVRPLLPSPEKKRSHQWYYFSDSSKRPVNEGEVLGSEAYILFYDLSQN